MLLGTLFRIANLLKLTLSLHSLNKASLRVLSINTNNYHSQHTSVNSIFVY